MSILEYNTLTKRISETESILSETSKITDALVRDLTLPELRRQLQHLYDKKTALEDALAREKVSLRIYGDKVETGRVSTRVLLKALEGFQSLTDSVANAMLHLPTQKGKIPSTILDLTDFQVTGVFAGSFGITLEKENGQLEAYSGLSQLTEILEETFNVLEASDRSEVLLSTITPLGKRVTHHYREWLTGMQECGVNLEIDWNDNIATTRRVHLLSDKVPNIVNILDTVDSVKENEVTLTGTLTGINIRNLTFELVVDGVGLIKGKSRIDTLISLPDYFGKEVEATLIQSISTTKGNVNKVSWYLYKVQAKETQ